MVRGRRSWRDRGREGKRKNYRDVEADKVKMLTSGLQKEGLEIWQHLSVNFLGV